MLIRFLIRPPRQLALLALAAAFFATFFFTSAAHARLNGVASTLFLGLNPPSCNGCHNGGTAPAVDLTANSSLLVPGTQIMLTFTVTTINADPGAAGFNLRSSQQGTFAVGGPNSALTQVVTGTNGWSEATHTNPKQGEPATFTVLWTPGAAVSGTVTFTAWGNSVNQSGTRTGDQAASDTLEIPVSCTPTTWYRDMDMDMYGNPSVSIPSCSQPAGYVANASDCNDGLAAVRPGATEMCNGVDDNCNTVVDDGLPTTTFYRDADGDGFGSASSGTKLSCSLAQAGADYVANASDCNDGNGGIHPGLTEICNGVDDDCNNGPDDGFGTLSCGDGPCRVSVPACLGGVPQICVPMCPDAGPDADAAVPPPVDANPVQDTSPAPDAVAPPDVAVDARPADASTVVDAPAPIDAASTPDARADAVASDAAPGPDGAAVVDASSPPDAGAMADAIVGTMPDARADAVADARADGATRDAQATDAGAEDMPGEGCSCRVVSTPSSQGAAAMAAAMLLLMTIARRLRQSRTVPATSRSKRR